MMDFFDFLSQLVVFTSKTVSDRILSTFQTIFTFLSRTIFIKSLLTTTPGKPPEDITTFHGAERLVYR